MASITGIERVYNLTSLQEGMLYHSVIENNTQDYIVQTCMNIDGNLRTDLVEKSLQLLSLKHDVLRTLIFYRKVARPRQVILKDRIVEIVHFNITNEKDEEKNERLVSIREADRDRGFDLEKDPLLRITLVRIDDNKYEMIWTFHHIIMDGWCLSLLYGDFMQFYNQLEKGVSFEELKTKILKDKKHTRRYEDYIKWLENQDKDKGLQYWSEVLKDYENDALIPKSTINTECGEPMSEEVYSFSKELTEKVREISVKYGVTISNIMESAWGILLQHYSRCNDVVFGKVVSGRNANIPGIEQMIGLFINTIPERIKCHQDMTVEELWNDVKNQAVSSGKYDYCSLAEVQNVSDKGNYLINTLYVYENYFVSDEAKQSIAGLTMSVSENHEKTNYDITLSVSMSECIQLSILYQMTNYHKEEIQRILKQLEVIVASMIENTKYNVNVLPYMTEQEEDLVKNQFNNYQCDVPVEKTSVHIFEETVARRAKHNMLRMDGKSLTYEDVNKRVNRIAHTLRQQGIKPGDYVALLAKRSFEMILGILGIIKAGGAYVPIDPTYPQDRIQYILNDCNPKAVLCYQAETENIQNFNLLDLENDEIWSKNEENLAIVNTPEDIMYVIYTSGTTGNPKGVMVRHRNLVNLFFAYNLLYEMSENDTVLQFASIAFDQSVWEVFGIILMGGTLCLTPYEYITDPERMELYITENNVTVLPLTPAYIRELDPKKLKSLRAIESGGAAADLDILKKWYRYMKVFNTYGPTETTVNATTYILQGNEKNSIPIGKPMYNCQVYILDEYSKLCGIGCPGELCVAGAGVSAGYLNRADLTEEKFIDNPYGEGKLYRTGDLAKWRSDGNIEYMGRIDEQVKIRGFRIELGEIEAVLLKQQGIKDAAVIVRTDKNGEKFIAAYFVSDEKNKDIKKLTESLRKVLPNYMIPTYLGQIEQIPLTKNGKLNVKALPEAVVDRTGQYKQPETEVEKIIVQAFEEVLLVNKVGVEDNFFELGGHSLKATRVVNIMKAQLSCNVTVKDMFMYPTPKELAEMVEARKGQSSVSYEKIPIVEKKPFYPMSSVQKRLYMVNELDENSTVYNMPGVMELSGEFSLEDLNRILVKLVERHAVFRTRFGYEAGEPVQYVEDEIDIKAEYAEMLGASSEDKKQLMEDFVKPFDLSKAPLLRVKLVKTSDSSNLLMFDMHHIICDGVSSSIIQEEFMALFNHDKLEDTEHQYVDYSQWMLNRDLSDQKKYWVEQFSDDIPVLELPYDFNRPQYQSFRGKTIRKMLNEDLTARVKKLAAKYEATEFMVYLAAYMMLLSRYSRQDDIVVGSPVSGRVHQDTEKIVGMFVNTLPFRANVKGDKLFSQFLLEVKDICLKGYENQEYPFEELLDEVNVQRNVARNPIFDVAFVMQNTDFKQLSLNNLIELDQVQFDNCVAKFDLTVTVDQIENESAVTFEYCADLFQQDNIMYMLEHFISLLENITLLPDSKLDVYNDVEKSEKEQLLNDFNQTDAEFPDKTVVELFEEQVEKTPQNIAAVFNGEEITYFELNRKANVIAKKLSENKIGSGDYVMLMTERSIEMIIAICAVIKVGAIYVPIDPNYPKDRIEYIVGDCKPKGVLTTQNIDLDYFNDTLVLNLTEEDYSVNAQNLELVSKPNDGIYVIYTSGTTGRPKGVIVTNRNVVRLFKNSKFAFDFGSEDVWMLFHYYGFDFSVWEIYGALLFGGKLLIPSKETTQNPKELQKYITENGLTVLNQVPSAFYALMDEMSDYAENKLRYLIFGGEALEPLKLLQWHRAYPNVKIINMYGITETTVHVTYREITEKEMMRGISDIGSAIPTLKVYILNGTRLCGVGVPGELCVAGDGVALGYLNQPELTDLKFVKNPFGDGRLYRSGDLARWLPDGNLEYRGRIDQQVKVRGFRIELNEIANVIRKQANVKDAVVVLKENKDKEKYIIAYIISADGEPTDFVELKDKMRDDLPEYMLPSGFKNIDKIPLTINGKLNAKALPEIDFSNMFDYVEPKTEEEKLIAQAYSEVLSVEKVGANDNFFEIGGHSLKASRLLNLLENKTGIRLTLRDVLMHPVVHDLAQLLKHENYEKYNSIPKAEIKERYLVSTAQRRLYTIQKMNEKSTAYNMPAVVELHGQVDIQSLKNSFAKLIERHEALRTTFEEDGDKIYQIIHTTSNAAIEYEEKLGISQTEKQNAYQQFIQPFDLGNGPLIRLKVVKISNEDYMLMFDVHHVVADGISLNILIYELMELYNGKDLPENNLQYKDYSEWVNSIDLTSQKEYWLEKFSDEIPVLNLITDYQRPSVQDYKGDHIICTMPQEIKEKIEKIATKTQTTEFMVMISIWAILLGKYGNTEDLVVGTPISGREHKDLENILGMFVNTLALRMQPQDTMSYMDFLMHVKEVALSAFENQEYPFDELAEMVSTTRNLSRNPVFDVMFTMQNTEQNTQELAQIDVSAGVDESERVVKFDLTLNVTPKTDGYLLELEYATSLFNKNSMELMLERYQALISEILDKPQMNLCEYSGRLVKDDKLESEVNDTDICFDSHKNVIEIFEECAQKFPDNLAVWDSKMQLSYQQLNCKANTLANYLVDCGVNSGDTVAIVSGRSANLIIAILAVIKAGGVYVPIDPDYPEARVSYMLNDCSPAMILTDSAELFENSNIQVFDINNIETLEEKNVQLNIQRKPNDLIYIIYTSGTTGKPKGVLVEHIGVVNLREYFVIEQNVTPQDRVLQFASMAFDAMVSELCMSILTGASMFIVDDEIRKDSKKFEAFVAEKEITAMILPPQFIATCNIPKNVRTIITAGSETNKDIVLKNGSICRYSNDYGPTECTVCATHWEYKQGEEINERVPIGKPIGNKKVYVMKGINRCPIKVPGELCVSGVGIARGYLNQDKLTKEKFIANPFGEGVLYRTGDFVRMLEDGNIEFLGRIDEQVKIRGYRIELSEIENILKKQDDVTEAVVLAKEDKKGEKFISAYLTGTNISLDKIRQGIRKELPEYMMPSFYTILEEIPVTQNGKVNKKKLLDIELIGTTIYEEPVTDMEKLVAEIFMNVLDNEKVGATDNFFEIGGHSLRATRVINELEEKTGIRMDIADFFAEPTVRSIAMYFENNDKKEYTHIPKAEEKSEYLMSPSQKRIFAVSQMDKSSVVYNMPSAIEITGNLTQDKLNDIFNKLVKQHEVLRTSFMIKSGELIQKIEEEVPVQIEYFETTFMDKEMQKAIYNEFVRPFDLGKAPLMRIKLVKMENEKNLLLFDMHHIISDGMSMNIIQNDFMTLYNGGTLEEQKVQYKDYSEWLRTQDYANQKKFWTDMYEDEIPVLDLPLDYVRPQIQSYEGKTLVCMSTENLRDRVRKLTLKTGTTEYMVLLAAFMVLLHKYSRQEDIVVGSPVSGRFNKDTENMLGMFVNSLPLRAQPVSTKNFDEFLQEVKKLCIDSNRNQAYSFDELVEELDVKRDMSRNPLFDVMFALQNNERLDFGINQLKLDGGLETEDSIAKFDLTVNIDMIENEYRFSFEYCKALFYDSSVSRMMDHYIQLIKEITENIETPIFELNMITEAEENQILYNFNNTDTAYNPDEKSVIQLFEECVEAYPELEAVCYNNKRVTYSELNKKANQICSYIQSKGVKAGDFVAVLCDRSIETIYAILAIVKAGAAYVPIEADYPEDRIGYILQDCKPALVLTIGKCNLSNTEGLTLVDITDEDINQCTDNNVGITVKPDARIYMIYTSGTTGKPKGCMIKHKSVIRLVKNTNYINCTEKTVILQTGAMSFDASTFEIWGTLLNGGKLVLADKEIILNPVLFKQTLVSENVNTMFITTALFNQMLDLDIEIFDSLDTLMTGGEKISVEHVRKLKSHNSKLRLLNMYGPTENTTYTTAYEIPQEFHRIPIGQPISNTKVYIINNNQLCGIGVPGELCTAGEGTAEGYLNNPETTKEKFVENKFGEELLYRTGDLARWLEDGTIEFLGRIDQQVKIHGFRIEPEEIEQILRKHTNIENAVVIVRTDANDEKYLAAFLVGEGDVDEIRIAISKELPEYMIPTYMTFIPFIPVNSNGKLDVKALPETVFVRKKEYVKAENDKEQILIDVCEEVLRVSDIGMNDNFFELGGDSIKAIRMISRLREKGYSLDVKTIMQERYLFGIAKYMDECQTEEYTQDAICGEVVLTPVQQEFFEWNVQKPEHFNQSVILKSTERIDIKAFEETLKAIVIHHDMLRAVYKDGKQFIRSVDEGQLFTLQVFDYLIDNNGWEKAEAECENLQSVCNLENGPLVRAAIFRLEDADHILITIHHLVIDGVSWRILMEDIPKVYQMCCTNCTIELPKKTASFQLWANSLKEYAGSSRVLNEMKYWKEVKEKASAEKSIVAKVEVYQPDYVQMELTAEDTKNLLLNANTAYKTEINDILLAGLVHAVYNTYGNKAVSVMMEGHGREELNKPIHIDRTVGWFTSIYPVVFDYKNEIGELLIDVKETIRKIPNHGIGYGVLKHLAQKDIGIEADITFNYLGDFGKKDGEEQMMELSRLSGGNQIAQENRFGTDIIVTGNMSGDVLTFDITYNKISVEKEKMEALVENYKDSLKSIIEHCMSTDEEVHTASDFGDTTEMDEDEWAAMAEFYSDIE